MEKEIKYIGFYDVPNAKVKRAYSLAATNKMDYICEAFNKADYKVHLISHAWFDDVGTGGAISGSAKFTGTTTIQLNKNKKLTLVPSFSTSKKITGYFKIIFSLLWLLFWLVINVKRNEKIVVYHSPWLAIPILVAKRLKRFKLILEVEEIYSDVSSLHSFFDNLEQKIFKKADFFFLSTELLAKRLNTTKPYLVIYGNYKVYDTLSVPPNDGKIHLVYAGIIDSEKAGAFNAAETSLFLSENYVMHIIGFGEVDKLKKRISEINKVSKCKVVYDGLKINDDFVGYCQACHIGLSTQKMDGEYLNSSFPSKVLTYLGMGLKVVSCYVPCVVESKVGGNIVYYKKDTPKSIAEAILKIDDLDCKKNKLIISKLNKEFTVQVNLMFNK
jgi:hypothetical protein